MPALSNAEVNKFLRRISAVCGWLLYVYEWVHVSYRTPSREAVSFAVLLIWASLLIHLGIASWIAHNKRLAARGTRGRSTRYTPPSFSHDHLGRQLHFFHQSDVGREIMISIDGDSKFYAPAQPVLS